MFRRVPRAWIAIAELDILRDEGIAYGNKLLRAGVPAEINTYKGAPHTIMAMDGTYRLPNVVIFIFVYSIYSPFCIQGKSVWFMR
jgi:acetyl esterase/lipase